MYIRQGSFGQGLKFTFTGYQIPRKKEERSSWVIRDERRREDEKEQDEEEEEEEEEQEEEDKVKGYALRLIIVCLAVSVQCVFSVFTLQESGSD